MTYIQLFSVHLFVSRHHCQCGNNVIGSSTLFLCSHAKGSWTHDCCSHFCSAFPTIFLFTHWHKNMSNKSYSIIKAGAWGSWNQFKPNTPYQFMLHQLHTAQCNRSNEWKRNSFSYSTSALLPFYCSCHQKNSSLKSLVAAENRAGRKDLMLRFI